MSTKRHPYVYPSKNHNLKFPPEYVALFTPSKSGLDVQVFHPVKISRYVSYSVQHNSVNRAIRFHCLPPSTHISSVCPWVPCLRQVSPLVSYWVSRTSPAGHGAAVNWEPLGEHWFHRILTEHRSGLYLPGQETLASWVHYRPSLGRKCIIFQPNRNTVLVVFETVIGPNLIVIDAMKISR